MPGRGTTSNMRDPNIQPELCSWPPKGLGMLGIQQMYFLGGERGMMGPWAAWSACAGWRDMWWGRQRTDPVRLGSLSLGFSTISCNKAELTTDNLSKTT